MQSLCGFPNTQPVPVSLLFRAAENTGAGKYSVRCLGVCKADERVIHFGLTADHIARELHRVFMVWTQLVSFQCCFTATETIRLIRDEEPRTATSTFTQLRTEL